ncbi:hypothetical protein EXQ31_08520 [Clostridium botulinum]|uniref:Uncharacterized protein n=1 Tax=Clostridium botulinum (strain 657 / Type Ba4) TaxID=515621 RepID=A0A3F2ZSD2_CLOB6|nr:hypothetical protein [Clostridium botulinum]ACQ51279.1 hypothetical protein CLJ_0195 [Clostridium botulinum Ba4 str. 657]AJE13488.1 hypothetical protein T259_4059 [Clostridium botulinum CDC_1436]AXG90429.1 hypothetical protein AGE29_01055 [Clostridium botulinum]MBO0524990.1 hypothetical protein [Clostridium botulinum]MBO0528589.1 hypothetical protein [Clostridium botulinum]
MYMKILKNKKGGLSVILSSTIVLTICTFAFMYMYYCEMEMHCRSNLNNLMYQELKDISYNKELRNSTHEFFNKEMKRYLNFIGDYNYKYEIYDKDKNLIREIDSTEIYNEKLTPGTTIKAILIQKNTAVTQRLVNIISNESAEHKIEITSMKFIE